jgi:hypothetical protein
MISAAIFLSASGLTLPSLSKGEGNYLPRLAGTLNDFSRYFFTYHLADPMTHFSLEHPTTASSSASSNITKPLNALNR